MKDKNVEKCPGVLHLMRKLHQTARFTHKALAQSKFHPGTHLDVKGLMVRGIVANAALKTATEKQVSMSRVIEKDGGFKRFERR